MTMAPPGAAAEPQAGRAPHAMERGNAVPAAPAIYCTGGRKEMGC